MAGGTGTLLNPPPQIIVTGVHVGTVGGLDSHRPEVGNIPQQPRLNHLGLVSRC